MWATGVAVCKLQRIDERWSAVPVRDRSDP
jgi:hypothetical protein